MPTSPTVTERFARAMAATPDRTDRAQIAQARHACAVEARRNREQAAANFHLADSTTCPAWTLAQASVVRHGQLLDRIAELDAMAKGQ